MSLVGFKARNHPQQRANPKVDDRETPAEVFDPLHERFRFTLDACASEHNAKLARFHTVANDGLTASWRREVVWCNPPYSNIEPWLARAPGSGAELVVYLLPANRTEQGWWQRWVEPRRDLADHAMTVEFLPGRLRFIAHDDDRIRPNARPPYGCCLIIWRAP